MSREERLAAAEKYYKQADELFLKVINATFPNPTDVKRLAALQMAISRELIELARGGQ